MPIMFQFSADNKIKISFLHGTTTSMQKDPVLDLCYMSFYYESLHFLSSCNGLTLVCYEQHIPRVGIYRFAVINPLTKGRHNLPPISLKIKIRRRDMKLDGPCDASGIGFDDSTNTFKTVFYVVKNPYRNVVRTMVHSSGTSSWRKIAPNPAYPISGGGVFSDGRLHWLTCDNELSEDDYFRKIVWFDVKTEEFGLPLDPPEGMRCHCHFINQLVDLNGEVYFELTSWTTTKKIIDEEHARLRGAQQKLAKVEEKQEKLENRIDHAIQTHRLLEEQLLNLRKLSGIHKKPLSKAEREFKMEFGIAKVPRKEEVDKKIFMTDHTLLFPEDIIYKILSRLPIKSLARFRCVCKLWLKYINDPYLRTIHVKEEPAPLLFERGSFDDSNKIQISFLRGTTSLQQDPILDLCSKSPYYSIQFLGSCNGLILVRYEQSPSRAGIYRFAVINPLSKRHHNLPPIPINIRSGLTDRHDPCVAAGIGFDDSTNTFKTVFSILKNSKRNVVCTMVHSSGTSSWRKIAQINPANPIIGAGVFSDGRLHWLTCNHGFREYNYLRKVVWFDVRTEEFGMPIDPPKGWRWSPPDPYPYELVDLNGEVGYAFFGRTGVKLWILKHDEWVLHCSFDPSLIWPKYYDYDAEVSGCWNKDGDILLNCDDAERLFVLFSLIFRDKRCYWIDLFDMSNRGQLQSINSETMDKTWKGMAGP
ncbi:hypothetical protein SSX86_018226 [Deinandra increscens subsp. villosa]|uniref:F-box domain-containing protein n=1 Tax=Deinandra increscens subsp. villosa TaxID=3103831 RepID=A0AAP0CQB5_9ASTR